MKAIPALSHRHTIHSAPTGSNSVETIDRALTLLAEAGFRFEPVDRCPAVCSFCDGAVVQAA